MIKLSWYQNEALCIMTDTVSVEMLKTCNNDVEKIEFPFISNIDFDPWDYHFRWPHRAQLAILRSSTHSQQPKRRKYAAVMASWYRKYCFFMIVKITNDFDNMIWPLLTVWFSCFGGFVKQLQDPTAVYHDAVCWNYCLFREVEYFPRSDYDP